MVRKTSEDSIDSCQYQRFNLESPLLDHFAPKRNGTEADFQITCRPPFSMRHTVQRTCVNGAKLVVVLRFLQSSAEWLCQ